MIDIKTLREETELVRLFMDAKQEVYNEVLAEPQDGWGYGFQDVWEEETDEESLEEEIETIALDRLWAARPDVAVNRRDRLDRFCLKAFRGVGSPAAIDVVVAEIG